MIDSQVAAHRLEQQRARIETIDAEAAYLLKTAQDESMKEQVRIAVRDVQAARKWHDEERRGRDGGLAMIDALPSLADARLNLVTNELARFGPGAQFFG